LTASARLLAGSLLGCGPEFTDITLSAPTVSDSRPGLNVTRQQRPAAWPPVRSGQNHLPAQPPCPVSRLLPSILNLPHQHRLHHAPDYRRVQPAEVAAVGCSPLRTVSGMAVPLTTRLPEYGTASDSPARPVLTSGSCSGTICLDEAGQNGRAGLCRFCLLPDCKEGYGSDTAAAVLCTTGFWSRYEYGVRPRPGTSCRTDRRPGWP